MDSLSMHAGSNPALASLDDAETARAEKERALAAEARARTVREYMAAFCYAVFGALLIVVAKLAWDLRTLF